MKLIGSELLMQPQYVANKYEEVYTWKLKIITFVINVLYHLCIGYSRSQDEREGVSVHFSRCKDYGQTSTNRYTGKTMTLRKQFYIDKGKTRFNSQDPKQVPIATQFRGSRGNISMVIVSCSKEFSCQKHNTQRNSQ